MHIKCQYKKLSLLASNDIILEVRFDIQLTLSSNSFPSGEFQDFNNSEDEIQLRSELGKNVF